MGRSGIGSFLCERFRISICVKCKSPFGIFMNLTTQAAMRGLLLMCCLMRTAKWSASAVKVKRYAVLDDELVPGHPLFRTSSRYGLTAKICKAVIQHFVIT